MEPVMEYIKSIKVADLKKMLNKIRYENSRKAASIQQLMNDYEKVGVRTVGHGYANLNIHLYHLLNVKPWRKIFSPIIGHVIKIEKHHLSI